jgi:hypothetical protein
MNILLHKKNRLITSVIFAIAFVMILVLGFKLDVFSGSPEPEGRTFDSTGTVAKSVFIPQEHGYITIKAYRVNISSSSTVPSQMNFYIKQPSGLEIGYDSQIGMGTVNSANVTKVDGILYVPVQIGSTETGDSVNLKLAVTYTSAGVFDALSNYTNCDSGQVQKLSEISRVEYINGSSGASVQKSTLSPLCVKVVRNSLQIVKTTYLAKKDAAGQDINVDIAKLSDVMDPAKTDKTANFEAGNKVIVVLEIDELDASRSDFKITDYVPPTASGSIDYFFISANANEALPSTQIPTIAISNSVVFYGAAAAKPPTVGPLTRGKNYLIYRYKI